MFWFKFTVELSVIPILEKEVLHDTELVRVDWVIACGLYIDVRLFLS
jgi:hypothetical protein